LIDEELDNTIKLQVEEQKFKNDEFINEIQEKVEKLKIYVPTDKGGYTTISGVQPDGPSLLSQIAG